MKILYLTDAIPPYSAGGPGKRIYSVCKEYVRQGHEVILVSTVQDKKDARTEKKDGMLVYYLFSSYHPGLRPYLSLYNPSIISAIRTILNEHNPDVLHADNIHQFISYAVLKLAYKKGIPAFITARDAMMVAYGKIYPKVQDCSNSDYRISWRDRLAQGRKSFNPLREFILRRYLRYANTIFSNSDFLKNVLQQNGIKNIKTIHNGVDVVDTVVESGALDRVKKQYDIPNASVVFLPGRLNHAKGVFALLDSFQEIKKRVPRTMLLFAGASGKEAEQVASYADSLGIREDIRTIGWMAGSEIEMLYEIADVVVSPSLCVDFFPGVNMEAAAHKKPVITTCFGGGKEFILDGETGYIVNPYNVRELGDRITDLISNPNKAYQFGIANYHRLIDGFTIEHQAKKLLVEYESAMRGKNNIPATK